MTVVPVIRLLVDLCEHNCRRPPSMAMDIINYTSIETVGDDVNFYLEDDSLNASGNNTTIFDYDYGLDVSFETYNYYDLIPTAIIYGITLITGLVGKSNVSHSSSSHISTASASHVITISINVSDHYSLPI